MSEYIFLFPFQGDETKEEEEDMARMRRARPQESRVISVRLPEALAKVIDRLAARNGSSIAEYIRKVLAADAGLTYEPPQPGGAGRPGRPQGTISAPR